MGAAGDHDQARFASQRQRLLDDAAARLAGGPGFVGNLQGAGNLDHPCSGCLHFGLEGGWKRPGRVDLNPGIRRQEGFQPPGVIAVVV